MSNVQEVFITSEIAEKLDITAPYLIRVAKEMGFSNTEFREAKKHTYLFSEEAVEKLSIKFHGDKKK
ncbi:MAG: AraC family transcriptional regulator [Candidatus Pacebacteria bacterium]|nr:AraC family transcriptional regulator [Candidatus Paceibacterota bacterium]